MIIYTMKATFLKCQILMFFSVLECKKRKSRSLVNVKMATLSTKFVPKTLKYFSKGSFFGFN